MAEDNTGTPFIHRPDELDIRDGALCWLNGNRVCGADCTAFNVEEVGDDGDLVQGPNKCLLLLYLGQQASAAMSLLASSKAVLAETKRREADKKRESQGGGMPLPPDSFAGRQK